MASYEAVIKLIVQGEEALKRIQERVDKLYKTINDLESKKKYAGSEAAAKYVREQANELERVVAVSKQLIQQDERRIIQQSKLNAAVDLYERRLQQTVNSGAAGLKKFQSQIADIQTAFAYFKDKGNVQAVQALATELGRMVEYSNNVNRNERARVANQSKVFEYVKQINAYEEKGLNVAKAREKLAQFTEVAGSNQLNTAKKYAEAIERQLKLLKEQEQLQRRVAAETASLQGGLEKLLQKQAALENSKLDQKALQIQQALDREAAAAAETAAQTTKLNARQTEFIERTNAAAQAAARQTAEFYRLQRLAKEFNAIRATAPAPQLMLPNADMLNAAVRGIQALETAEDRRNRELAEGAARLKELERLEISRERRAQKLQGIADYQRPAAPTAPAAPAAGGIKGMLQKPGVADAIIGGSFPLLFGGGAGATIGGAAGGFIGGAMGGPLGMALSLGLSAVGQQIDAAVAKIAEMQKAINSLNVDALRESFIVVNAELETTIQRLIDVGKYDEARAAAAKAVTLQTGALGTALEDSAAATNGLANSWNELLGTASASLSMLAAPFAALFAVIIEGVNFALKGVNTIISGIGQGIKWAVESVIRLLPGGQQLLNWIQKTVKGISGEEQKRVAALQTANLALEQQLYTNRQVLELQKQLTLGRTQVEKEINAEINTQISNKRINAEYDAKAVELRRQYADVTSEAGRRELKQALINNEAKRNQALEEQRIQDLLVQQGFELDRNAQRYAAIAQTVQFQIAALERTNEVKQSEFQLQTALNNLYGVQLEKEYGLAQTAQQRYNIALKQFGQQVNAARIEYEQALANNRLLVEKAILQAKLIQIKYDEIKAEKEIAIAQATARGNTVEQIDRIKSAYDQALGVQQQAVDSAYDQVSATQEVASNQDKVAKAVYDTKVYQAEAALSQKLSSDAIGLAKGDAQVLASRLGDVARAAVTAKEQLTPLPNVIDAGKQKTLEMASAMESLGRATEQTAIRIERAVSLQQKLNLLRGGGSGPSGTVTPAAKGAFWPGGFKAFANGGIVRKPTLGLIGEGGEAEYIVPASKATSFSVKYLSGERGQSALTKAAGVSGTKVQFAKGKTRKITVKDPSLPSLQVMAEAIAANKQAQAEMFSNQKSYDPFDSISGYEPGKPPAKDTNINITTGPVVEFDGTKYVTLADLEAAMRTTVNGIVGTLRTPAARSALGMV